MPFDVGAQHAKDLKREMAVHTRKAAVVMSDKLARVIQACITKAGVLGMGTVAGFALVQDATYFALLWSSSIRGGNLDSVRYSNVVWLPNKEGVMITLYQHKTAATQKERKRMIAMGNKSIWMDPVRRLQFFQLCCEKVRAAGLFPEAPFLFRDVVKGVITDAAFDIKRLNKRLESYLVDCGLFAVGERVHGIRAAEPIESVLRDGNLQRALRHGDWADTDTAMGYLDLASTISLVYEKDEGWWWKEKDEGTSNL